VVDFDHHSAVFAARPDEVFDELRSGCPVAYSPNYGGFWVLTRYEDVRAAARDHQTYSSVRSDQPIDGVRYEGITIPPVVGHSGMAETDPPEWNPIRRFLTPFFSPAAVERLRPAQARWATACLDQVIESGRAELIDDLVNAIPALVTLDLLGLPLDLWQWCADVVHAATYQPPGPGSVQAWTDFHDLMVVIRQDVAAQRDHPGPGVVGHLVSEEVGGQRLTDDEIVTVCQGLIIGGVDTTTSLLSHALLHLHRHHDDRQRLIDDPALLPVATEEFLRMFTPSPALARTVTTTAELGDQQLCPGDRLLLAWAAANRDPDEFDRADEVVLDRMPNRHLAFGAGLHRCIGSSIARSEFATVMGEVLRRIPDYEIDEDGAQPYPAVGVINGYLRMPARFTPGPVESGEPLPPARPKGSSAVVGGAGTAKGEAGMAKGGTE